MDAHIDSNIHLRHPCSTNPTIKNTTIKNTTSTNTTSTNKTAKQDQSNVFKSSFNSTFTIDDISPFEQYHSSTPNNRTFNNDYTSKCTDDQ